MSGLLFKTEALEVDCINRIGFEDEHHFLGAGAVFKLAANFPVITPILSGGNDASSKQWASRIICPHLNGAAIG